VWYAGILSISQNRLGIRFVKISWISYPKSREPSALSLRVVRVFEGAKDEISSEKKKLTSNEVLAQVRSGLEELGFDVESGKKAAARIPVPVLFGFNGRVEKYFDADAYHRAQGYVVEVEAGRAVVNNQFLKDLFQACMMHEVSRLAIAVRTLYGGGGRQSRDFDRVVTFFDTLYASQRIALPLKEVLIIGY
ncbi:MAG: hypothetical protein AAGJ55_00130, partial [Cyanobacteria bacterium J06555_12]